MQKILLKKDSIQYIKDKILEIKSSDINVTEMMPKNELNEKFWVNGRLNSKVRVRIMDIADDFIDFLNIKWVKPIDVIFTGSLANFNWTKFSDIDIHILIDFSKVYKDIDFVNDYFEMKKRIWSQEHDSLKIYGFPIELYVENSDNVSFSSGVFSIEKNKWIKFPSKFNENNINEKFIKYKSSSIINKIDCLYDKSKKTNNENELNKICSEAKKLFKKLKFERKKCLSENGEVGNWNIIYKIIRKNGRLEKLWNISSNIYDKINSI